MFEFCVARRLLTLAAGLGTTFLFFAGCDDGPPVANDMATCSELGQQARAEGFDVLASAERSCSVDSECVVSQEHPRCTDPCGYRAAVAVSAVSGIEAAMREIESQYCDAFERQSCSFIAVPCVPMGESQAVCRDGQCELESEAP
ncbi:MAG TPA: hypothetical protein VJU61_06130 [Polyangiaceae bacterium]|nr:hypothetical protein [Polyangiaceae bacterium]